MKSISYAEFSGRMNGVLATTRLPASVSIEMTYRCPLTCVHCYNNLPMGDEGARTGELSREEHLRLLDELAQAQCLWLLYTGGEIFARPDFLDIYTYARQKGFLITLFTNGTMITPKVADHLARWRPFSIEITMYGRTKETYEALTGIPGSYERCLRGIDLLIERGLPLTLKTVAVTINKHEVWQMQAFAEERGVPFKFDAMMNPRIDCSASPLAVRLTPEECVALDLEDPRRMDGWKAFAETFMRPANPESRAGELYHCGGGVNSFAIDPYGRMSICVLSQQDKYDLRSGSVADGWDHFLRRVRAKPVSRTTKCTSCELKSMCGMCPANGELENGDPESPVDYLCRVAHLRAFAFELPVAPHGPCEYCEGGPGHDEIKRAAANIRRLLEEPQAPAPGGLPRRPRMLTLTPVSASGEAVAPSGGCGSCAVRH